MRKVFLYRYANSRQSFYLPVIFFLLILHKIKLFLLAFQLD